MPAGRKPFTLLWLLNSTHTLISQGQPVFPVGLFITLIIIIYFINFIILVKHHKNIKKVNIVKRIFGA